MEVLSTPETAQVTAGGGSGAKRSREKNKGKKLWEKTESGRRGEGGHVWIMVEEMEKREKEKRASKQYWEVVESKRRRRGKKFLNAVVAFNEIFFNIL